MATTSALIRRVPGGHGAITCGVAGAALGATVLSFTGSVSVLTVAAGIFSVSSFVTVLDAALGAVGFFEADSGAVALGSTAAFSTEAVGVCAAIIDALIKIRVIVANEMTKSLGVNLKPSISLLLCIAQWTLGTEVKMGPGDYRVKVIKFESVQRPCGSLAE